MSSPISQDDDDVNKSVSRDSNVINSYREAEPIIKSILAKSLPRSTTCLDEDEDAVDKVYTERIQYRSLDLNPTTGASSKIVETVKPETALETRRRLRVERIRKQRAMRKAQKRVSDKDQVQAETLKIMSKGSNSRQSRKMKKIDIRGDLWNWIRQHKKAIRSSSSSGSQSQSQSQLSMCQFERLADLWADYASNLIFPYGENVKVNNNTTTDIKQISMFAAGKISSADLHGCRLTVVRAHCVSLVGIQGIVAVDSKNSFVLAIDAITKNRYHKSPTDNMNGSSSTTNSPFARLVTVPKYQTVFQLCISTPTGLYNRDHLTLNINGSRLMFRSAERSSRKFKSRQADDLT